LRLWDVEARRPLGTVMPDVADNIYSVAFSPNGMTLASTSDNLTLWDFDPETWLEHARRIANRDLIPEERKLYLGDYPK
jgi:WD40 repeat protein